MAQPSFQGQFIWHELLCNETHAASAFYERILPWKAQPFSPGSPYLMFKSTDGKAVAGAMRLSDDAKAAGTAPHWRPYIGAADVDAIVGQAVGLGARIQQPVQDVPGVGRVALLTDPEGATFGVYCPLADSGSAPASSGFAWNELAVRNREAGLAFYQKLFGWKLRQPMDMGGGFYYQTFGMSSQDIGGAYTIPADRDMPPSWCPYAVCSSADVTANNVKAAGGQLAHGPVDVPGGGRIVQFFDLQGAYFAVHSMPSAASAPPPKAAAPKPATKTVAKTVTRAVAKAAPKSTAKSAASVARKAPKKAAKKAAKRAVRKAAKKSKPKKRSAQRRAARPKSKSANRRGVKRKPARRRSRAAKRKPARKK